MVASNKVRHKHYSSITSSIAKPVLVIRYCHYQDLHPYTYSYFFFNFIFTFSLSDLIVKRCEALVHTREQASPQPPASVHSAVELLPWRTMSNLIIT